MLKSTFNNNTGGTLANRFQTLKVFGRVAGVGTYSAIKHVAEVIDISGIEQVFSYSLSFLFGC